MQYATLASGIEAATVAWKPLGWEPLWFSEIEPFPCALLSHYYDVPNLGDMNGIKDAERADLIMAGTPCQSFSIAGLRKGMDDPRGNLTLVFLGIVDKLRPQWVVWENVFGILSSWTDEEEGATGARWQTNDFDTFVSGLKEIGYSVAWRVLDAQYFGVAQRRRRVFLVGHLGDWRRAAAVLFERKSLSGNTAPSREKREAVAGTLGGGSGERGWNADFDRSGAFIPEMITGPLTGNQYGDHESRESLLVPEVVGGLQAYDSPRGHGHSGFASNQAVDASHLVPTAQTLRSGGKGGIPSSRGENIVTVNARQDPVVSEIGQPVGTYSQDQAVAYSLRANPSHSGDKGDGGVNTTLIPSNTAVRRLTPLECERLMGLPDNYTRIPYRGKPAEECPDGPRYRVLGNSIVVSVMEWIGRRIEAVERIEA